jgi:hypothetical protein
MAGNYFDLLDEYSERDRPLSFHWNSADFAQMLGLPRTRNSHHEATINAILAEAILAAESGKRVSYSARRGFYSQGTRYRGTAFTYATVMGAIAMLARAGWITDCRVAPGNLGWQSSFAATDRLMEAWRSTDQRVIYSAGEIIWLKNRDGILVDYVDTRTTRQLRRQLAGANDGLAGLAIDVPGAERRGHHMFIGGSYLLPTPGNHLRRIFGRGSWSLHGRAYGWWQSIPKTVRHSITLNGEPVVEADYGSLHAAILYNQAGVRFVGDAYAIDGHERDEIKLGFNIALNAKNDRAAVAAIADGLGCDRKHASNIISAIKRRHKPIQGYFCSDAGIRLMRIDSDLILRALRAVNDNGDPALPVHDALIVPARCADPTAAAMTESFEQVVGRASPCSVKIKAGNVPHMGERGSAPRRSPFPPAA